MIKQLTILFLLFSITLFSQTELNLDNNLTGIYSDSKSGRQIGLNFLGNNTISKNKFSIDFGTNYLIRYNKVLTDNELIQRLNLSYNKEKCDFFLTYQYNYSLVRSISSDNWIGVGGGLKNKFNSGKVSISYALIFQNTDYIIKSNEKMFRNSFRLKFKIEKKSIGFSTEYYYQPSFTGFNDYIVYGTTKVIFFVNKPFNLIIQDFINYRSISDVKMIHNLTLGFGYKFNKKIEKKI
jgi:hypothetical protein